MNKLLSMLGLARRAGKLAVGFDAALEAVKTGRAAGAAVCADISEKTYQNIKFAADRGKIPAIRLCVQAQEAGAAVGKRAGVFAICDAGFFKAVQELNHDTEERVSAEKADRG